MVTGRKGSFCDSVNAIAIAIQRWLSLDSAGCRHPALVVAVQHWQSQIAGQRNLSKKNICDIISISITRQLALASPGQR